MAFNAPASGAHGEFLRSGPPAAPYPAATAPTLIGERYRVEAALGRGGAAQVYRVVDQARGRTLALKLLHASVHSRLTELFELEYQTLASLEHSHTPRVFEFGRDPRGVFYTMELLEGGDLSEAAPLTWRSVCDHVRDACQALGLLHARSLIHRDVSPRNLWRTPDGRIKLIDFGAIAPFGPNALIIGTPPLLPPEALAGRALDQRADLFSLGAVSYYLLTGRHAYPARKLEALHELWRTPPALPSHCVAQLARPELEPVPKELDVLVLALLSGDLLVRPSSAAEVIDRIDVMLGAAHGSEHEAAYARLTNAAYVGRTNQRRQLARRFVLANAGRGQACVIEAAPGGGRSRALKEIELAARIAQAHVVYTNAAAEAAPYGVANALALALLDAVPELARTAALPHAPRLAHLSPRLRERLEATAEPAPELAGELRVRIQEAQRDWTLAVAAERPLVLLVDGLEHADEASVAAILALALKISKSKLLLVCTLARDPVRERSTPIRALVEASHLIQLPPLSAAELHTLLHSVFGAAEHLSRLSGRLHELSGGHPAHALELCRQLVDRGLITFESGTWHLPRELDPRSLSSNREHVLVERLARAAGPARELARRLSVHSGPLTPGLCRALATSGGDDLLPHLGELIDAEVLVASGQNLLFAYEVIREACARELPEAMRPSALRALAEHLAAAPDAGSFELLQAGLHWTTAGDARGPGLVVREATQLMVRELDRLAPAAPTLEAALQAFRARGCSAYEQVVLLTALTLAGYEGDRRFILQYGEDAVRTLEAVTELPLARKLARVVGGKLGLGIALGLAGLRFLMRRRNPCVPGFVDALTMLFTAVAATTGASSIALDPTAAARHADVLRPFAALGLDSLGGFMHQFSVLIAETPRDRLPETHGRWRDLLARMMRLWPFPYVSEAQMRRMRGGALYAMGSIEAFSGQGDALQTADELERNGQQFDLVCSNQIRMIYHGLRGDLAAYERYRQRAELHAIARGTTWQIETWMPGSTANITWQLHDALGMKHASEQMLRLSRQSPSLEVYARSFRGSYLVLRGKYSEALPWLVACLSELPFSATAWGHRHGVLACAYNRLGDYAHAHAACMRVYEAFTEANFAYASLNLVVETERAIAEAGIGDVAKAREQLERLHKRHGQSENPLVRGPLFEAGFEIALIAGDFVGARHQLIQIESLYRPLNIPSLAQLCESLAARIDERTGGGARRQVPRASASAGLGSQSSSESSWSIDRLRTGEIAPLAERAQRALRLIATSTKTSRGLLYLVEAPEPPKLLAALGDASPSDGVRRWVADRLAVDEDDAQTVLESALATTQTPWNVLQEGELTHRMLALITSAGDRIGAAVVSAIREMPQTCSTALVSALADQLYEAAEEQENRRATAVHRNRSSSG